MTKRLNVFKGRASRRIKDHILSDYPTGIVPPESEVDQSVEMPLHWFQLEAGTPPTPELMPGESATGILLWPDTVSGERVFKTTNRKMTIHDPEKKNFGIAGDRFLCWWNANLYRWEIIGSQNVHALKAKPDAAIASGSSGTVSLYRNGADSGYNLTAHVNWRASGAAANSEVVVDYFWDEDKFVVQTLEQSLVPISLTQTGGSNGTTTTKPSYTYTITNRLTGTTLGTNVDPTSGIHRFTRANGVYAAATHGFAYVIDSSTFEVHWINEQEETESC